MENSKLDDLLARPQTKRTLTALKEKGVAAQYPSGISNMQNLSQPIDLTSLKSSQLARS